MDSNLSKPITPRRRLNETPRHDVSAEMNLLVKTPGTSHSFTCLKCETVLHNRYSGRRHVRTFHLAQELCSKAQPRIVNAEQNRDPDITIPDLASSLAEAEDDLPEMPAPNSRGTAEIRAFPQPEVEDAPILPKTISDPAAYLGLLAIRHKISFEGTENILRLLKLGLSWEGVNMGEVFQRDHCQQPKLIRTCSICGDVVAEGNCPKHSEYPMSSFASASLADQICHIAEREIFDFWDPERFREAGLIRDCRDGENYKRIVTSQVTDETLKTICISINSDGLSLTKSSSAWPILGTIDNIIPSERKFLSRNIVIVTLYQDIPSLNHSIRRISKGKVKKALKPLKAMVADLNRQIRQINENGLTIKCGNQAFRIQIAISKALFDTVAKASFMNMAHHNGAYPCNTCEIKGKSVKRGKGSRRSFATDPGGCRPLRRTKASIIRHAKTATAEDPVKGIKGIPLLSELDGFDYGSCVPVDDMHGPMLGVTKLVLEMWFCTSGRDYSLSEEDKGEILRRLAETKFPEFLTRLISSLNIAEWKASQFRFWLLYAFIVTMGVVKPKYLHHFALLSQSIALLSTKEISQHDLLVASCLLEQFCGEYSSLYGIDSYGINVHNLLHLADYVDLHGPLFESSLFPFENFNGFIKSLCHAKGNAVGSVLTQLLTHQILDSRTTELTGKEEQKFCDRVKGYRLRTTVSGSGWRTSSAPLKNHNPTISVKPGCSCSTSCLRYYATAEVGSLAVWTAHYMRPERRQAKYFLLKERSTGAAFLFEVMEIVHCVQCNDLYFAGEKMTYKNFSVGIHMSHILVSNQSSRAIVCFPISSHSLVSAFCTEIAGQSVYCTIKHFIDVD